MYLNLTLPEDYLYWLIKKKIDFSFSFTAKLTGKYKEFHILPFPIHAQPSLLSTSHTRKVHLLTLMNLYWHKMITQSPHFIPGLTFSVIHSIVLDKSTGHVSAFIIPNIFTIPKFCVLPIHTSLLPTPGNYWFCNCIHSFAFFSMSYSKNPLVQR